MSAVVVHLSDLHFGDTKAVLNRKEMQKVLEALLCKAGSDAILVLSGDITFKGRTEGYEEATLTMQQLLIDLDLPANRIIVCPGNHDIVKAYGQSYFAAFDVWSASMRNDMVCSYAKNSCRHVPFESIDFLLLNSAYHGDIGYGLIDLDCMDLVLSAMGTEAEEGRIRVAVMHHHLVPVSAAENSTTRNAYGVLSRLAKHGFSLVLHGHQHMLLSLHVGEKAMNVSGVGSCRYLAGGYVNSATIHRKHPTEKLFTEFFAVSKDVPGYLMQVNPPF